MEPVHPSTDVTRLSIGPRPRLANRGLAAVFGSTFLELVGVFMLSPLMLFQLKAQEHSTLTAGLFAACGWVGVLSVMPLVSGITHRLGRQRALWLAAALPLVAIAGFLWTDKLWAWFVLEWLAGMAGGLRWVLAEAAVAEFSPTDQRGRYVGLFETMVGATFVAGPMLLAWVGTEGQTALWWVAGLSASALAWSLWIPPLPLPRDEAHGGHGLRGMVQALRAYPVVMVVGLVGGFFESGMSSLLPL